MTKSKALLCVGGGGGGEALFNILILKSHFLIFCFIMNYSQLLPINTDKKSCPTVQHLLY